MIDWIKKYLRYPAIIVAATIGSGMFALPYVITRAGWLTTLIYFIVLGAMVVMSHAVYLKTLAAEGEHERLLGLGRKYFGSSGFWFGFVAIVFGLLLSFVIFLILGTQFLQLLFPVLSYAPALFIFWLIIAVPALIGNRRAVSLEVVSVLCVAAIIIFIFALSHPAAAFVHVPAVNWQGLFLPFGTILFMLAGWTGIEPFYETAKYSKQKISAVPLLILGTSFAVILYVLFAAGILSSAPRITADIVSALGAWPLWKRGLVAILGIFAIGIVSTPISHEIRNALEEDLGWNHIVSRLVIVGLPLVAVLSGFNNFLAIVGLSGGLFIGMEYLLIIAVGRRALTLGPMQKFFLDFVAVVFIFAAVYSVYTFIVH